VFRFEADGNICALELMYAYHLF